MFKNKLKGNVLIVFSDPGGAKPCLALSDNINDENLFVISDRNYPFYKHFKSKVHVVKSEVNLEDFINNFNPNIIFTGTSYTSDIEKRFIRIAKEKNIPCHSFVDHWTNISRRFIDEFGNMILPDMVWVIDERAKLIALKEGICETKLVVSGNPYHSWLKKWKPSVNKEAFFKELGLQNKNQKIIVYAPDPLSNVNGQEIYGFDELSATSSIVELFEEHHIELKEWIVLVKCHPNQDSNALSKIITGHKSFYLLPETIDTNCTIYYSDVVIGFFSSFLIEASLMNKSILRLLFNNISNDPLFELNIGKNVNVSELILEILNIKNE